MFFAIPVQLLLLWRCLPFIQFIKGRIFNTYETCQLRMPIHWEIPWESNLWFSVKAFNHCMRLLIIFCTILYLYDLWRISLWICVCAWKREHIHQYYCFSTRFVTSVAGLTQHVKGDANMQNRLQSYKSSFEYSGTTEQTCLRLCCILISCYQF